jgi:transcriptional regulator of acetoin/glycerol metabolism
VLTFRLPPLRERRADVLPLAEALLADLAERFGRTASLSERARAWLPEHDWPGNLRQLRNSERRCSPTPDDRPERPGDSPRRPLVGESRAGDSRAGLGTRPPGGRPAARHQPKNLWEKRKRYGVLISTPARTARSWICPAW